MNLIDDFLARRRQLRAKRMRFEAEPCHPRITRAPASPFDQILDGLLISWHEWRCGYTMARGYSGSDSTCRDFRTPTHWDWKNGAEQDRAEDEIMLGVDRAISRVPNVPERWGTALEFEARNLHSRAAVWSSPVLPRDRAELDVLRLEARNLLLHELRREGVLS